MNESAKPRVLPPRSEMLRAFADKNPGYDGVFFVAVRTTGIFCRPSCPSRPLADHVEFHPSVRECLEAGFRPCRRCRPLEADGRVPEWVAPVIARVEADPLRRVDSARLRADGVSPERLRRWFLQHYGMTFSAWCRGLRLAAAFTRLREGASVDDAVFDSGFESHSGFRDAFVRAFGEAPGHSRVSGSEPIVVSRFESTLGPLLAGASDAGIHLLEFADRRLLERDLNALRRRLGRPLTPGSHRWLDPLRDELRQYFEGRLRTFSLPLAIHGTPFQTRVWNQLRAIPYGTTISYAELARRIGQPSARRAVAQANGLNRICILIPCHRVIAHDGSLSGYGGGVWRKHRLLEIERAASTGA